MLEARVVSISLGSAARDFRRVLRSEDFELTLLRVGTGGRLNSAGYLVRHFDGNCAALGLEGAKLAYRTSRGRYPVVEGQWLAGLARYTPVVDGSGIQQYWEPGVVRWLEAEHGMRWPGTRVLVLSALDCCDLAAAMEAAGACLRVADPATLLGLPFAFPSLARFEAAAAFTLPVLSLLPLGFLHPGARPPGRRGLLDLFRVRRYLQEQLDWAQVVCGDIHFLERVLPGPLGGKIILTSGLEPQRGDALLRAGAELVVDTDCTGPTGSLSEALLEAACVALAGRRLEELDEPAREACFTRLQLTVGWWRASVR
jgi:hypothetical protein